MAIYARLRQEHSHFKQMLGDMQKSGSDKETRQRMLEQVKRELQLHMKFEEETFYPELRKDKAAGSQVDEAYQEHKEVARLIDQAIRMDASQPDWVARIKEIQRMLVDHVEEEEDRLFKVGHKVIGEDRANEMLRQYEAMRFAEMRKSA